MSRVLLFVVLLVLASFPKEIRAQGFGRPDPHVARKFDDFGDIQYSDLIARLDNFAIQLQNEPASKGFILVYRSRRDLPGLSSRLALWSREYMVNSRGVSEARVISIDGGVAAQLTQELWIVPMGTAPKPRSDAYPRGWSYFETPLKFDEFSFSLPSDMAESGSIDGSGDPSVYLEGFVDALLKEPRSRACIIVYAGYYIERGAIGNDRGEEREYARAHLDSPGTARRRLRGIRNALLKTYHIPMTRVSTIDGGYRKVRAVELWIVPRGEHLPIATPNSFPPKRARSRK